MTGIDALWHVQCSDMCVFIYDCRRFVNDCFSNKYKNKSETSELNMQLELYVTTLGLSRRGTQPYVYVSIIRMGACKNLHMLQRRIF